MNLWEAVSQDGNVSYWTQFFTQFLTFAIQLHSSSHKRGRDISLQLTLNSVHGTRIGQQNEVSTPLSQLSRSLVHFYLPSCTLALAMRISLGWPADPGNWKRGIWKAASPRRAKWLQMCKWEQLRAAHPLTWAQPGSANLQLTLSYPVPQDRQKGRLVHAAHLGGCLLCSTEPSKLQYICTELHSYTLETDDSPKWNNFKYPKESTSQALRNRKGSSVTEPLITCRLWFQTKRKGPGWVCSYGTRWRCYHNYNGKMLESYKTRNWQNLSILSIHNWILCKHQIQAGEQRSR